MRVRSEHGKHERGHYITMSDIYRIRKTIEQEDSVAGPFSSNQPSYERSKDSPVEVEELLYPEDVSEAGTSRDQQSTTSTTPTPELVKTDLFGPSQVDVKQEVSDEPSNGLGCADPGTPMSPTPGPATHQLSTPGVTVGAESTPISVDGKTYHHLPAHLATRAAALPPLPIPPQRGRHPGHRVETPVSAPAITFAPVIGSGIHSAPAPTPAVVPASQVTYNIIPPVAPPHDTLVPYYTPQPLVVYVPHPPYQMTQMVLYPVYPAHYPSPH